MSWFKFVFCRAIVLYGLIGLLLVFGIDHKSVASHAWPKTLSRLRPDYGYLLKAASGSAPDKDAFIDGKRYFMAVDRLFGSRPDANAFLAMSAYYLGDRAGAKQRFLQLKAQAPGFFWVDYDLALLAWEAKDQAAAATYGGLAMEDPLDKSLAMIMTAKVYQPLLVENGVTPAVLVQNMQQGRMVLVQMLLAIRSGVLPTVSGRLPVRVF